MEVKPKLSFAPCKRWLHALASLDAQGTLVYVKESPITSFTFSSSFDPRSLLTRALSECIVNRSSDSQDHSFERRLPRERSKGLGQQNMVGLALSHAQGLAD
jgi:hypothetical protein